jgi:hypothetical protein
MAETDAPNWLNNSFFETALRAGGYGPSVTVTSCQIGRGTVAGDNYACEIYRAKLQVALEGRLSSVSLILKTQPAKGEVAKVNILFCLMLNIPAIPITLKRRREYFCNIFIMCSYLYMFNIYAD